MVEKKIVLLYTIFLGLFILPHSIDARIRRHRKKRNAQMMAIQEQPSCTLKANNDLSISDRVTPILLAQNIQADIPKISTESQDNLPTFDKDDIILPVELQQNAQIATAHEDKIQALEQEEAEKIELNLENADLTVLIKQIEDLFGIMLLYDEMIQPIKQGSTALTGNKISFRTNKPLTKKEIWNLFNMFLDVSGFALVHLPEKDMFRIQATAKATKSALPVFIGTDIEDIPATDELIRYIYFVQSADIDAIFKVVDALRSPASNDATISLKEHKAFILTDRAYNIKMLLQIVKELDRTAMPQAMSVVKLRRADAEKVRDLYKSLLSAPDAQQPQQQPFGARRQPTSSYFPENMQIFAEPTTNALILLGAQDAIKKVEDFIIKNFDQELDQQYTKLFVYDLKFASAEAIERILTATTAFGKDTPAGHSGSVRGVDKYLKRMSFIAEKETNRLIIRADYDDYLAILPVIKELDEAQPQVAIEVLIVSVSNTDIKSLGSQLRSKQNGIDGLYGNNIKFQTSGVYSSSGVPSGIVQNSTGLGVDRLLGNLLNVLTGSGPGSTVLTLGQDLVNGVLGVWGVFQALQSLTNAQILSNPFLIATNNTKAEISVGETRRVQTTQVIANSVQQNRDSFDDDKANLTVLVTPQINSDGMVILSLDITFDQFTTPASAAGTPAFGSQINRHFTTKVTMADQEVLALGGLVRDFIRDSANKVPLLGEIPVVGWLFKNKYYNKAKDNLLILISTQIIEPERTAEVVAFTDSHVADYHATADASTQSIAQKDPISRWFFKESSFDGPQADSIIFQKNRDIQTQTVIQKPRENNTDPHPETEASQKKIPGNAGHDTSQLRAVMPSKLRKKLAQRNTKQSVANYLQQSTAKESA